MAVTHVTVNNALGRTSPLFVLRALISSRTIAALSPSCWRALHPFGSNHDAQICPTRYLLKGYRRPHFPRQVRIIEFVAVTNAFVRLQFEIFSTERVGFARGEIRERHLVSAADLRI